MRYIDWWAGEWIVSWSILSYYLNELTNLSNRLVPNKFSKSIPWGMECLCGADGWSKLQAVVLRSLIIGLLIGHWKWGIGVLSYQTSLYDMIFYNQWEMWSVVKAWNLELTCRKNSCPNAVSNHRSVGWSIKMFPNGPWLNGGCFPECSFVR